MIAGAHNHDANGRLSLDFEAICIRFVLLVRKRKFTCQSVVRATSNDDLSHSDRFLTKESFAAFNV